MYIFADIRRPLPERGRARLHCFNQYLAILQTPISHYCNTMQSPILQTASTYAAECSLLFGIILQG